MVVNPLPLLFVDDRVLECQILTFVSTKNLFDHLKLPIGLLEVLSILFVLYEKEFLPIIRNILLYDGENGVVKLVAKRPVIQT